MGIEYRQQGQRDARPRSGRHDALAHLGDVGVVAAVAVVMQIVEFADAREARFQHFDVELRGDRFDLIWRHRQRKAIHDLAPAPETVGRWPARFRQARHAALECVAVKVGHCRQEDAAAFVAGLR